MPISIDITETTTYSFELEVEDVEAIMEMKGGFTYDNVREWAIDLYENSGVDKTSEGYQVGVDFVFDDPHALSDLLDDIA